MIPVVLSGGAGTRLWPVSRKSCPKPFMQIPGGDTLLGKTIERATAIPDSRQIVIVTNTEYYFQTKELLESKAVGKSYRFLLESEGRNTAPAILMTALMLRDLYGSDEIMAILPADHLIRNVDIFSGDIEAAERLAQNGYMVTFGIKPTHPDTGFGYIMTGTSIDGNGYSIEKFIEKPQQDEASKLVLLPNLFWNSGMFCFSTGTIINAFEKYAPDLLTSAKVCWQATQKSYNMNTACYKIDEKSFSLLQDISIDYAIIEKANNVAMIPAHFDWTDVGSWKVFSNLAEPDKAGNRGSSNAIYIDSHDCYVQSTDRVVATIGLNNIVIIDTPDALLVSQRDETQKVKEVVAQLKAHSHKSLTTHRTVTRPWGAYTILEDGNHYKIKRIEVKPGGSLSLQMHHHRSEHWIVVNGTARVVNGEQTMLVHSNESTYIPAGHQHRLENPGVVTLVMIEVQNGEYLGEDDIVRFKDIYGRA